MASLAPFQWFSVIVIPLPAMLVLQALLVDLIFSKRFYIAQPIEIEDPKIKCPRESHLTSDDSYYLERALCWRSHPPQRQNCCLLRDFQIAVELPKMMS